MQTISLRSKFLKFLFPSLGGAMVMSIYTMADAIVVGKGVGADGIAALSLTAPPYSLLMAVGLLLGIGSSVHISIRKGSGQEHTANSYFTMASIAAAVFAVGLCLIYMIFLPQIVSFVGASGELYDLTYDYLKWLARFAFLLVPSFYLSALLRADGDPNRAMVGVISGGVINVVLDIVLVLVLKIGIGGAAIASIAGIFVQDIIFLSHFFSRKNTLHFVRSQRPVKRLADIFQSGVASFINELANAVIVLLLNRQILAYLGTPALSVYGVISNCVVLFNSVYSGVGQAVQPLVSYAHGAGKRKEVSEYRKLGLITACVFGAVFTAAGILFPQQIAGVFVTMTDELAVIAGSAIPKYFIAFLPMAVNVFMTYYLQSVLMKGQSLIISLARNIVLSAIAIMTVPLIFGGEALWFAIPAVEYFVLAVIAVFRVRFS